MPDLATLQARLAEAEAAYHEVMLGLTFKSVNNDGQAVTYAEADGPRLANYIESLKSQIGRLTGSGGRRGILVEF